MKKLLKYEIKYKGKALFIGTIIVIALLILGKEDVFNSLGTRIFGKTLNFSTLPEQVMTGKIIFLSGISVILLILWAIDLSSVYNKPLNFMIPKYRGDIVIAKIVLFIIVLIYIDIIFIVDMIITNYRLVGSLSLDFRNYILIGYLNLLYLAQLIFIYDLIIIYKNYVENVSILYFILISTNINPSILFLGNAIFYNRNTRLNLETLKLQSMSLVDRVNGDLWNPIIINEGLDLMALFLGLVVGIIIFIGAYNLMDEKV